MISCTIKAFFIVSFVAVATSQFSGCVANEPDPGVDQIWQSANGRERLAEVVRRCREGQPVRWAYNHEGNPDCGPPDFQICGVTHSAVAPHDPSLTPYCSSALVLVDIAIMEFTMAYEDDYTPPGLVRLSDMERDLHAKGLRFSVLKDQNQQGELATRVIDPEPACVFGPSNTPCLQFYVDVLVARIRNWLLASCGQGLILNGIGVLDNSAAYFQDPEFRRRFMNNAIYLVKRLRQEFPKIALIANNPGAVLDCVWQEIDGVMLESFLLGIDEHGPEYDSCVPWHFVQYYARIKRIREINPDFAVLTIDRSSVPELRWTSIATARKLNYIPYVSPHPPMIGDRAYWRTERFAQQFDTDPNLNQREWNLCHIPTEVTMKVVGDDLVISGENVDVSELLFYTGTDEGHDCPGVFDQVSGTLFPTLASRTEVRFDIGRLPSTCCRVFFCPKGSDGECVHVRQNSVVVYAAGIAQSDTGEPYRCLSGDCTGPVCSLPVDSGRVPIRRFQFNGDNHAHVFRDVPVTPQNYTAENGCRTVFELFPEHQPGLVRLRAFLKSDTDHAFVLTTNQQEIDAYLQPSQGWQEWDVSWFAAPIGSSPPVDCNLVEVYRLTKNFGGDYDFIFTTHLLEVQQAQADGWSAQAVFRACEP